MESSETLPPPPPTRVEEGRLRYEHAVEQSHLSVLQFYIGRHIQRGWNDLLSAAGDFGSIGMRLASNVSVVGYLLRDEVAGLLQEIRDLPATTKEMWKNGDFLQPLFSFNEVFDIITALKTDFPLEWKHSVENAKLAYSSKWSLSCKVYLGGVALLSAFTLYHYKFRPWLQHDHRSEIPCLHKTVVITGASSGIGYRLAYDFVKRGALVILTSPDLVKARKARLDLSRKLMRFVDKEKHVQEQAQVRYYDQLEVPPQSDIKFLLRNIVEIELNLSSTTSIYTFTRQLQGMSPDGVDILINNAALNAPPEEMVVTDEGKEAHFSVNYFGHFVLTNLLIGLLAKRRGSRIINVTCKGTAEQAFIKMEEFIDPYLQEEGLPFLPAKDGYANSKLAMYLFNRQLSKELQLAGINNITTYCVCPGTTNTNLNRHMRSLSSFWSMFASSFNKKPWHAVQPILHCALSPACSHESGFFYENCQKSILQTQNRNQNEIAEQLWKSSMSLMEVGHNAMLRLTEQMHILSHENIFQLAGNLFLHRRDVMTHLLLMEENHVYKTKHKKHVDEKGDARENFTYFWNGFYLSGGKNSSLIERWVLQNTHPGFRELQKEYDVWFECTGSSYYHPQSNGKMGTLQYMTNMPEPLLQEDIEELEKLYESDPERDEEIEDMDRYYHDYIAVDEFL